MTSVVKRKKTRRTAAVAVEMAMTIPVLMLFLFASYEFGRANFLRHACEGAAYEGARKGIIPGATADEVRKEVEFVMNAIGARQFDIIVDPAILSDESEVISVTVRLPVAENTFFGKLFLHNAVLVGECRLNREGFLEELSPFE